MSGDLAQVVGEFEAFLVEQKKTSDHMSKFADSNLKEVSEKASLQLQVCHNVTSISAWRNFTFFLHSSNCNCAQFFLSKCVERELIAKICLNKLSAIISSVLPFSDSDLTFLNGMTRYMRTVARTFCQTNLIFVRTMMK